MCRYLLFLYLDVVKINFILLSFSVSLISYLLSVDSGKLYLILS